MAMVAMLRALDFAVMRPMALHRAGGAQLQGQGLEALLYTHGQSCQLFHHPPVQEHLPSHAY
jgi:hypothetical protein